MDLSRLPFISKSLMKTARICTERMWKLFVEGIPSESSPAAKFGIDGHRAWSDLPSNLSIYPSAVQLPVRKAQKLCPEPEYPTAGIGYEIELSKELDGIKFRGRLDRLIVRLADNSVTVDDLKLGQHEDDPFERNLYIWLTETPMIPESTFRYICPTEDQVFTHTYSRTDLDALPNRLRQDIAWLESLPIVPTPGEHCEDMYGIPCQFLGRGCSLDKAATDIVIREIDQVGVIETLDALLDGRPEIVSALPAESVAKAYVGLQQLSGITKQVQKNIRAWAETNGQFSVGDTEYGIVESPVFRTDKFKALQLLLKSKDLKTILSAIDISNSTIEKCKDLDVKALLEAEAVRYSHNTKRFGVIKKEITE